MRKILVTGALGFVGRNVVLQLSKREDITLFQVDIATPEEEFDRYINETDFVIHLAGVNRPKDDSEFVSGNSDLTKNILQKLSKRNEPIPFLMTSSIQSDLDNAYGRSKREAENAVFQYMKDTGSKVYVFKLPNLFGKFSRPNYNSVVSTFCYNISHNIDIIINDPTRVLTLVYIDDLLKTVEMVLDGKLLPHGDGYCYVEVQHEISLKNLAKTIKLFHESRKTLVMPVLEGLNKKLYSTYLSYLEEDDFSYELVSHSDNRGGFYEFFKTESLGQVSVSTTVPGITRGNHWHHTKVEKFLVVSGKAAIRFRKIGEEKVIEYIVSEDKKEVVDIPPGYTHSITNISSDEILVTLIWANELFSQDNPDTFFEEV